MTRGIGTAAAVIVLTGGWLVISEGALALMGVVTIGAATATWLALRRVVPPGPRPRWRQVLRFVPTFLWQSCLAGVDVAVRAFHPRLPIRPGMIDLTLELEPGAPRLTLALVLSVLPGTLAVELGPSVIRIHLIDTRMQVAQLRALEARIARLFSPAAPTSAHPAQRPDEPSGDPRSP